MLAVIGGVFVLEAVSVIVQVTSFKLTGKRFRMAPIHHHFEQKGWTEPQIVIRFWIISVMLALAGLSTLKLRRSPMVPVTSFGGQDGRGVRTLGRGQPEPHALRAQVCRVAPVTPMWENVAKAARAGFTADGARFPGGKDSPPMARR